MPQFRLPRPLLALPIIASFFSFLPITYHDAHAQAAENHVEIRLLPEKTDVEPGGTVTVGIEQTLDQGWHTYWTNPGDSGTAARIQWSAAGEIKAAPIQWPVPKKLPMGPLVNFGYEEKVTLLQDITLPENLPDGPQEISAEIEILVCHEICIPETHKASFTVNGSERGSPAAIEEARAALPLDMGWETSITEEADDIVVHVATDTPGAFVKLDKIELYPEEWGLIDNTQNTRAEKDAGSLTLRHKRGERSVADVPVSKLVIAYEDARGARKAVRVSTIDMGAAPPQKSQSDLVGIAKAIGLAFLGGLILNLMPCVFPVLSMKALSLVKLKDKELSIARKHGIAYTLGILACFTLVAGVLIALKAAGAQVGWGFQLQHPVIILFLAYLFFTLGLNLAGYFEIDFGLSNAGHTLTRRTDLSGSFFTGVLATLVATPCTAPFMGAAMGFALTQPAAISLLVFLSLGLGLAAPYLALTFLPALRHMLPHPGVWMERLRQFLAFPLFGAACWMLWVLAQQINHMGQFGAFLGLLFIALGIWFLKARPQKKGPRLFFTLLAMLSFIFTASTFLGLKSIDAPANMQADKKQNWEDFSRARLGEYLDGEAPVFVNMTAAWCITCKVNERVALSIDSTRALFEQKGVKYLKGDWTNQNPEITAYLEEYGRSGVPIYVYYGPRDGQTGARPAPVVLPQLLTPGIVENALTSEGDPNDD